jgi:membrane-associated phospholipid phosphatase
MVLGLLTAQPETKLEAAARRSLVYAETFLASQGLTFLGKTGFGRPRPYAYEPSQQRDIGPGPFPANTVRSMPSGHSSSAWAGAAIAITEHPFQRPEAGGLDRFGVGFVGGALAGSTSALRVTAGQHFPSDVIAGAGVGLASGIAAQAF